MAWTSLPEVPWWTLFTGMLCSMVWVTVAYLLVSAFVRLMSAFRDLGGRCGGF